MGLTDQVGERVLFTNCDDLPSVMDDRSGFYCIRGTDLDRLTKDDLLLPIGFEARLSRRNAKSPVLISWKRLRTFWPVLTNIIASPL
jgi:hypothetical protein